MIRKWTLGIVFEKVTRERIEGYLAQLRYHQKGEEIAKDEIIKTLFEYNPKTGIYRIYVGGFDTAKEIGRQLKREGYKNVRLLFNDKEYEIK